jgi:hypothetical protein
MAEVGVEIEDEIEDHRLGSRFREPLLSLWRLQSASRVQQENAHSSAHWVSGDEL